MFFSSEGPLPPPPPLLQAIEAARELNDSIKDDIWHELARAKYALWQQQSAERKEQLASLKEQLPGGLVSGSSARLCRGVLLVT